MPGLKTVEHDVDRVRQGETGHRVRYILAFGLLLAIASLVIAFALAR